MSSLSAGVSFDMVGVVVCVCWGGGGANWFARSLFVVFLGKYQLFVCNTSTAITEGKKKDAAAVEIRSSASVRRPSSRTVDDGMSSTARSRLANLAAVAGPLAAVEITPGSRAAQCTCFWAVPVSIAGVVTILGPTGVFFPSGCSSATRHLDSTWMVQQKGFGADTDSKLHYRLACECGCECERKVRIPCPNHRGNIRNSHGGLGEFSSRRILRDMGSSCKLIRINFQWCSGFHGRVLQ